MYNTTIMSLFRLDVFKLLRLVHEVVGVCFWNKLALVRLLNEVFVALLLGEMDCILLSLETQMSALHGISRGLPAHKRIFPSVALL